MVEPGALGQPQPQSAGGPAAGGVAARGGARAPRVPRGTCRRPFAKMGATGSKDKLGGSSSMSGMSGIAGGAGGIAGADTGQSPELKCAVPVQFRWHHGAQREVYVVGSFSNWQTKIRLTREEDSHFGTVVQIVPGIHQYKFIVDGEWRCAQDQPRCLDSVGNENNCIEVEEAEQSEEPAVDQDPTREDPPSPRNT